MSAQVIGQLVTANTAEFPVESDRQKWYQLVPYGQESAVMASGHKFTVDGPGRVILPGDPGTVHVNEEHDRKRPVGSFDTFLDTAAGLFGRATFAETTAGNDALVLASTGLRKGISVELEGAVIRGGQLLRGLLAHAGVCVLPSFKDATVLAAAADVGEITDDLKTAAAAIGAALGKITEDEQDTPAADNQEENSVTTDTVQAAAAADTQGAAFATFLASLGQGTAAAPAPAEDPITVLAATQVTANLAATGVQGDATVLAAALDTITQADVFDKATVPQYVGELWNGRRYAGRYLHLVTPAPLVSQTVTGWRWVLGKAPQVAKWTPSTGGTMNDIPTNEVVAESKTYTGFRIAGGHKVDRIHVDLPSQEWWASYNLESVDDYARKWDAEIIAHVTAPANLTTETISAAATDEERIIEGMGAVADFADADYILIGWNVFKRMALAKKFDQTVAGPDTINYANGTFALTYLGRPVTVAPRSLVAEAERVLVGCQAANTGHSLPGGPVRVNALGIQTGHVEHGVFGYHVLRASDTRGVVDVKLAAA